MDLALSQPVPWRAYTLDQPRRLVIDFSDVRFDGLLPTVTDRIGTITTGPIQPGWSRMVVALDAPLAIAEAGLDTSAPDGRARLTLRLAPVTAAAFAAASGLPPDLARTLPRTVLPAPPPKPADRIRVVLDPGHGGIDPGAQYEGLTEADLMLAFARELRDLLIRAGVDVAMTRDADVFVPLEARVTFAREAQADLFLSLHADSLPEEAGSAHGATVYVLSDEASDVASQRLAERHDGADLVAGVDVTGQGDEIALVLMDMARVETEPRSLHLAEALIAGITAEAGRMNHRPLRSAGFSVLRSPSIPSVLVELGFLSSPRDREKIADLAWRTKAATGIRDALSCGRLRMRRARRSSGPAREAGEEHRVPLRLRVLEGHVDQSEARAGERLAVIVGIEARVVERVAREVAHGLSCAWPGSEHQDAPRRRMGREDRASWRAGHRATGGRTNPTQGSRRSPAELQPAHVGHHRLRLGHVAPEKLHHRRRPVHAGDGAPPVGQVLRDGPARAAAKVEDALARRMGQHPVEVAPLEQGPVAAEVPLGRDGVVGGENRISGSCPTYRPPGGGGASARAGVFTIPPMDPDATPGSF